MRYGDWWYIHAHDMSGSSMFFRRLESNRSVRCLTDSIEWNFVLIMRFWLCSIISYFCLIYAYRIAIYTRTYIETPYAVNNGSDVFRQKWKKECWSNTKKKQNKYIFRSTVMVCMWKFSANSKEKSAKQREKIDFRNLSAPNDWREQTMRSKYLYNKSRFRFPWESQLEMRA